MLFARTHKQVGNVSTPIRRWHRITPMQARFAKAQIGYVRLCAVLAGTLEVKDL